MVPASNLRQWPLLLHISTAPAKPPHSLQSSAPGHGLRRVTRRVAEERALVLARRIHDLAGIHQPLRIEPRLDLGQARGQARTEEGLDPLGAHQAVAMLAGVGALVPAHEVGGLLGDRTHADRPVALHVEDRAHVQAAHGGMRIPRAFGAVLAEHLGEARRVLGEVRQRHRAVLDEGHRAFRRPSSTS
jgi:hypothetical protein